MVGPTTNYIDSACFQAAFLRSYLGYIPILRYHRPVVPRAVARSSSTTSCQECWKDSVDTPLKYNMENRPIPKRKFYLSGIIFRGKLLNLRGEGYMFWDEVVSFVQWSRGAVPRFVFLTRTIARTVEPRAPSGWFYTYTVYPEPESQAFFFGWTSWLGISNHFLK